MAKKNINDQLVEQLLKKVEEKKAQIEKIRNPEFKTNLSFPMEMFGSSNRQNLNVTTPEILFSILVHIGKLMDYGKGLSMQVGVDFPSKWYGFTLEDWKHDVVLKIRQLQVQTQVRELREIENKLNSLMSEEKKKDIELQTLAELLSK